MALMLSTVGLRGYPEDAAVELHLDQGDSRSARAMSAGEVTAPFILRADYVTWKEMALGELDPRISVTRPRVAFTGKLATPVLHADATRAMVARAQRVPTRFT